MQRHQGRKDKLRTHEVTEAETRDRHQTQHGDRFEPTEHFICLRRLIQADSEHF